MKLSDLTPEEWIGRLSTRRAAQRKTTAAWWRYMDLEQPLYYVARILREQSDRFPPLLIAWPELVIESVVDRLVLEAFLLADDAPSEELTQTWLANDLDEYSAEAHTAAGVGGEAYIMVGPGDGPWPMITVEYSDQVAVEIDPRTRQPVAGLKNWDAGDNKSLDAPGALYLPGRAFELDNGEIVSETSLGRWGEVIAADHTLPSIPIVPMLNKPRRGLGRSDLIALKPIVDAANQFATNLMAAGEHHAVPRKWAIGASEGDFKDEQGNKIPAWKAALGDVWGIPHAEPAHRGETPQEIKVGQFAASDLRNFHESFKMLATIAASLYGLPPNYMGYSSDNPPSAESILYSLDRLVRRTEQRQLWYGGAWKRAQRIVWAILKRDPAQIAGLEPKWRNAATPTMASKADAAVKLVQAEIIDPEQAWNDIGYSETVKAGLRERRARAGAGFTTDLVNGLRGLDVGGGVNGNRGVPTPAGP